MFAKIAGKNSPTVRRGVLTAAMYVLTRINLHKLRKLHNLRNLRNSRNSISRRDRNHRHSNRLPLPLKARQKQAAG
ncbi:MAG: hypothetical protein MR865_04045 [Bacteroidales bacterium]|nr:hypothetical protein [Bacteroidales bacterium]